MSATFGICSCGYTYTEIDGYSIERFSLQDDACCKWHDCQKLYPQTLEEIAEAFENMPTTVDKPVEFGFVVGTK